MIREQQAYGWAGAWSLLGGYAKAKSQRVTQNPLSCLSRFISSSSDDSGAKTGRKIYVIVKNSYQWSFSVSSI